jgi:translation elongation factor EF-4
MELISRKRGYEIQTKPIDEEKWVFTAKIPWAEVVTDFHDQLKTVTSGFGSLDTTESNPPVVEANLCKVDMMLNGETVNSLSFVCHKDAAHGEGRNVCKKVWFSYNCFNSIFLQTHIHSVSFPYFFRFWLLIVRVAAGSVTTTTVCYCNTS